MWAEVVHRFSLLLVCAISISCILLFTYFKLVVVGWRVQTRDIMSYRAIINSDISMRSKHSMNFGLKGPHSTFSSGHRMTRYILRIRQVQAGTLFELFSANALISVWQCTGSYIHAAVTLFLLNVYVPMHGTGYSSSLAQKPKSHIM